MCEEESIVNEEVLDEEEKKGQNPTLIAVNPQGRGMMEILGIPQKRCVELCSAVEQTHHEHPDWSIGQLIEHAQVEHCKTPAEFAFMCYVLGQDMAEAQQAASNPMDAINAMLARVLRARPQEATAN